MEREQGFVIAVAECDDATPLPGVVTMHVLVKAGLGFVLCMFGSLLYAAGSGVAVGDAYALDDGRLLYTETHTWQGVSHTVQYFLPGGQLWSVNELDSSASFVSPAYTQNYPDSGFAEGARLQGSELILFSGQRRKAVAFKAPLVVNSGFYHFILEHWSELQAGQSLVFDFAVPSRMTTVRLRMHALANGAATMEARAHADPAWFYVKVEADSALLSWLVQPLTVAFDAERRMVLYRGISNVRDERDDTPQVLIRYRYPERALDSSASSSLGQPAP